MTALSLEMQYVRMNLMSLMFWYSLLVQIQALDGPGLILIST
jgi:hypothetical protein